MEWNKEKTTLFIKDYHNSPELWNNKSTAYADIKLKNDKLKQLATKYNTTVIEVKKKIKNLRSAFHRERKKLKMKNGSSSSKKIKWFAYEMLSFLLDIDADVPRLTTLTTSSEGEESVEEDLDTDTQDNPDIKNFEDTQSEADKSGNQQTSNKLDGNKRTSTGKIFVVPRNKLKNEKSFTPTSDSEEEAYNIPKCSCRRDEFTTYGEHVANELRNLRPRARTIVKHLMNNILFEAAIGNYDAENASNTQTSTSVDNKL